MPLRQACGIHSWVPLAEIMTHRKSKLAMPESGRGSSISCGALTKEHRMRLPLLASISFAIALSTPALAEPPRVPGSMGEVQLTFAPVVKRVAPAVVNVYARSIVQAPMNPFFQDPLFAQLFGNPQMRQSVQQSLGSGVIVRADGVILTNNHVVQGGSDIVVALSDKREFKARVLLADPRTDVAVLKIDT